MFDLEDCMHEPHVYQQVWPATEEESLSCKEREATESIVLLWQLGRVAILLVTFPEGCLVFVLCSCSTVGLQLVESQDTDRTQRTYHREDWKSHAFTLLGPSQIVQKARKWLLENKGSSISNEESVGW